MRYNSIEIENKKKFIHSIILKSEKNGNALNQLLIKELIHAFENLSKDLSCRVIILESKSNIFCAGADLKELKEMQNNDYKKNLEDSKKLMNLFQKILSIEKLVIAKVDGAAIAGGCGLATACDIIFGTENAKFGYTEVNIGFVPALVSTFLSKRVPDFLSKELFLTGKILDSQQAEKIHLIDYYVKAEKLDKEIEKYIQDFLKKSSPESVSETKKMLYKFLEIEKKMNLACEINAKSRKNKDCLKGISRFLKKERNYWN